MFYIMYKQESWTFIIRERSRETRTTLAVIITLSNLSIK